MDHIPYEFPAAPILGWDDEMDLLQFSIQVDSKQCTSCNLCMEVCPSKALQPILKKDINDKGMKDLEFFNSIPFIDRDKINPLKLHQQQFQQALFQFPDASQACGEAAYMKLLSQLFGDRMLVANATGSSSIFGGALPTTPWAKNEAGRGPAWSNSLFEDNAEFGYGFRLSLDQQKNYVKALLRNNDFGIPATLLHEILEEAPKSEEQMPSFRNKLAIVKSIVHNSDHPMKDTVIGLLESLMPKSVWIVGGDGWAYDIGFSGLDHVLASKENVNILVMDNEMYDNTGGQMSKATPYGAKAHFAHKGKRTAKKDLGAIAMTYNHVYVATVAIGADPEQTLKALIEAEKHDGPSLIIAYVSTEAHGYTYGNKWDHQKAAIASGHWTLYRRNPGAKEKSTFQLDSKTPELGIDCLWSMENRFEEVYGKEMVIH